MSRYRQMNGERNCLSFETAVGGIEPPSPRLALYRATTAPHIVAASANIKHLFIYSHSNLVYLLFTFLRTIYIITHTNGGKTRGDCLIVRVMAKQMPQLPGLGKHLYYNYVCRQF